MARSKKNSTPKAAATKPAHANPIRAYLDTGSFSGKPSPVHGRRLYSGGFWSDAMDAVTTGARASAALAGATLHPQGGGYLERYRNPQTSYGKLVDEVFPNADKSTAGRVATGAAGFVGDVVLDPLTYFGIGMAGKGAKLAEHASPAVRAVGKAMTAAADPIGTAAKPIVKAARAIPLVDSGIRKLGDMNAATKVVRAIRDRERLTVSKNARAVGEAVEGVDKIAADEAKRLTGKRGMGVIRGSNLGRSKAGAGKAREFREGLKRALNAGYDARKAALNAGKTTQEAIAIGERAIAKQVGRLTSAGFDEGKVREALTIAQKEGDRGGAMLARTKVLSPETVSGNKGVYSRRMYRKHESPGEYLRSLEGDPVAYAREEARQAALAAKPPRGNGGPIAQAKKERLPLDAAERRRLGEVEDIKPALVVQGDIAGRASARKTALDELAALGSKENPGLAEAAGKARPKPVEPVAPKGNGATPKTNGKTPAAEPAVPPTVDITMSTPAKEAASVKPVEAPAATPETVAPKAKAAPAKVKPPKAPPKPREEAPAEVRKRLDAIYRSLQEAESEAHPGATLAEKVRGNKVANAHDYKVLDRNGRLMPGQPKMVSIEDMSPEDATALRDFVSQYADRTETRFVRDLPNGERKVVSFNEPEQFDVQIPRSMVDSALRNFRAGGRSKTNEAFRAAAEELKDLEGVTIVPTPAPTPAPKPDVAPGQFGDPIFDPDIEAHPLFRPTKLRVDEFRAKNGLQPLKHPVDYLDPNAIDIGMTRDQDFGLLDVQKQIAGDTGFDIQAAYPPKAKRVEGESGALFGDEPIATPSGVKEPWQMTRQEFQQWGAQESKLPLDERSALIDGTHADMWASTHATLVRRAVAEGKPVPAEVLKSVPKAAVKAAKRAGERGAAIIPGQAPTGYSQLVGSQWGPAEGTWLPDSLHAAVMRAYGGASRRWDTGSEMGNKAVDAARKTLSAWKFGKVVDSPAAMSRNIGSNAWRAWTERGINPVQFFGDMLGGAHEIMGDTPLWRQLQDTNTVFGSGSHLRSEFGGAMADAGIPGSGPISRAVAATNDRLAGVPGFLQDLWNTGNRKAAGLYEGIEQAGKVGIAKRELKRGATIEDAAQAARDTLFDYADAPYIAQVLGNTGAVPFIRYPSLAVPAEAKAFVRNPGRLATAAKAMQAWSAMAPDAEKQGREEQTMPPYLRNGAMIRNPFPAPGGMSSYTDATTWLPFGNFIGGLGLSDSVISNVNPLEANPLASSIAAMTTGVNPQTQQPISKAPAGTGEFNRGWAEYLGQQALPPLTPGIGFHPQQISRAKRGDKDRNGIPMDPNIARLRAYLGITLRPISEQANVLAWRKPLAWRERQWNETLNAKAKAGATPEELARLAETARRDMEAQVKRTEDVIGQ